MPRLAHYWHKLDQRKFAFDRIKIDLSDQNDQTVNFLIYDPVFYFTCLSILN